ncbi:hypothetical protein EOM33_05670 [Candidatus Saccharibacteria bacterium]|nr:hypothetical protein [Candidatus Saccharibacteria bacterium]
MLEDPHYFYQRYMVTRLGTIDVLARSTVMNYRATAVMRINDPATTLADLELIALFREALSELVETPDQMRTKNIDFDAFTEGLKDHVPTFR